MTNVMCGKYMEEVKTRVTGLDLLRGICALGISSYHFSSWLNLSIVSLNVGYYGVYIFFIISGASIFLGYSNKLDTNLTIKNFLAIRFYRLAPLYIFVLFLTPLIVGLKSYDLHYFLKLILNIFFAFGLSNPGIVSMVTGGWSLGIEFVFYLLFPVFLCVLNVKISLIIFAIQIAFVNLAGSVNDWGQYVQPIAFIWYFYGGCLLAKYYLKHSASLENLSKSIRILLAIFLIFCALIYKPETMADVLAGLPSIYMPIVCIFIVALFFCDVGGLASKFFGNVSYGVYLFHPLVFAIIVRRLEGIPMLYLFAIFTLTTLCTAFIFNLLIERPILNWAKKRYAI
jgi:peptidoglycan/LPS O-acetylase OafA/YrhL